MQTSINAVPAGGKSSCLLPAVLLFSAPLARAHDIGGWSAIHWHGSDVLGVALVTALSIGALWLALRRKRDGDAR